VQIGTIAMAHDRDGARTLRRMFRHRVTRRRVIWAESAYTGFLAIWLSWLRPRHRVRLESIKRSDHANGFGLLPNRWGVARPFGWCGKDRRLCKDDAYLTASSEARISMAMIHIIVRHIEAKTLF
jgi:putative transposase